MQQRQWVLVVLLGAVLTVPMTVDAQQSRGDRIVQMSRGQKYWEIEVSSVDGFVMGAMPLELHIGERRIQRHTFMPGAGLRTVVFLLTDAEFESLPATATAYVTYGEGTASTRWELGTFDHPQVQ